MKVLWRNSFIEEIYNKKEQDCGKKWERFSGEFNYESVKMYGSFGYWSILSDSFIIVVMNKKERPPNLPKERKSFNGDLGFWFWKICKEIYGSVN